MISIILSLDDVAARNLVDRLSLNDIAFGTANAMNAAMNAAQIEVRQNEYARVFEQRNKALSKALTTIRNTDRATKRRLKVTMQNVKDGRTGRMAGEGFIERQIKGGAKTGRGMIAIPKLGPGLRRLSGGSLPKDKKPRANTKLFRIKNSLVERQRKKLITRFVLKKTAKAPSKGSFGYLTRGQTVILSKLPTLWRNELRRLIGRASLNSRGMGGRPIRGRLV